jgi:hypothetical protein
MLICRLGCECGWRFPVVSAHLRVSATGRCESEKSSTAQEIVAFKVPEDKSENCSTNTCSEVISRIESTTIKVITTEQILMAGSFASGNKFLPMQIDGLIRQ